MDVLNLLQQQLGGDVMKQLSEAIGGSEEQTQAGVQAALPTLLGAVSRQANTEGGQSQLMQLLDRDGDGDIMDDLKGFIGAGNDTNGGSALVQQLLGGKQNAVESAISQTSGLQPGAAKNLLTQLAPMLSGVLNKTKRQGGMGMNDIMRMLQQQGEATKKGGNLGFVSQLLDKDGDGDITDDVMDAGKRLLGGFFKKK